MIKEDLTWEAHVADHAVPHQCAILNRFPSSLNNESLISLLNAVSSANICQGVLLTDTLPWKGIFTSQGRGILAYLDQPFCVTVNREQHSATIQHVKCELLVFGNHCVPCD